MDKSKSEYRVSMLRDLPLGLLGNETYSIVSATEVNVDLIKAEYFLLIQRPNAALYCGTEEFKKKVFPVE